MTEHCALMSALGLPPVNAYPSSSSTTALLARLRETDLWTAMLDNRDASNDEWDRWSEARRQLLEEIAALPPTLENARIKARAVRSIHSGDLTDLFDGNTTDAQLARQVIAIMGAEA